MYVQLNYWKKEKYCNNVKTKIKKYFSVKTLPLVKPIYYYDDY